MSYIIQSNPEFEKSLEKLKKKNRILYQQIQKKLVDLSNDPEHYKSLRNVLAGYRRIHFGSHVLIYKIEGNIVKIISLDHHDKAY